MAAALARRARVDSLQLTQAGFDCAFEEGGGGAPAAAAPAALSLVVRNFRGPAGTAYEGATFAVAVHLPASYPLASPSVGFRTRVYHPNVDEASGTVCLDVLSSKWSPLYSLLNVFEQLLPQLLAYPNPQSPLNADAAALLLRDPAAYDARVRAHARAHASAPAAAAATAAAAAAATAAEAEEGVEGGGGEGGDGDGESDDSGSVGSAGSTMSLL
jgi:ubiquitin-conjugating enzyme E2 H